MPKKYLLLVVDGIVNLALGILLMFFPAQLMVSLDLPGVETYFYVNILGAVLFGIGLALLLEFFTGRIGITGLGIGGAIAINLCGGGALVYWLLFGNMDLTPGGAIFLWGIAIVVLGIALVEFLMISLKKKKYRGSMKNRETKLLLWMFLPILIPYICDITLTLIGQPEQYWQGNFIAVAEANPISRWFLAKHPVVYFLYSLARFLGYGLLIAILPLEFSKIVSTYLIVAHTVGAYGWAKNVFYVGYWERVGLLLIPAILIVYSINQVNFLGAENALKRLEE